MAVQWVKVDADTYALLNWELGMVQVYSKAVLEQQQAELQEQLASIPAAPTDAELLAWARVNYPTMDYTAQVVVLQERLAQVMSTLDGIEQCTAQVVIVDGGGNG